jgi:hypothetical protein
MKLALTNVNRDGSTASAPRQSKPQDVPKFTPAPKLVARIGEWVKVTGRITVKYGERQLAAQDICECLLFVCHPKSD